MRRNKVGFGAGRWDWKPLSRTPGITDWVRDFSAAVHAVYVCDIDTHGARKKSFLANLLLE